MQLRQSIAIAIGGVCGAALRWLVISGFQPEGTVRWAVLALNVVGSGLLGLLLAAESYRPRARLAVHDFGGIGFCGGLTTFSTFSVEIVELIRDDALADALIHAGLSITLSLAALVGGAAALRRVRALSLALEERP